MNTIQNSIAQLVEGQNLSATQMRATMMQIMTGQASDAQIGGFLVALRMKGETSEEISAGALVMRELAKGVSLDLPHMVDIVGTGGDGLKTFNISTCCCFVAAAAGAVVAKHGNRSVSSTCGSADLLEAAGVNLNLNSEQVAQCVRQIGLGFMFAPQHHNAMKYAIGPRREMAIRTIFNLLGPLTNPAGVRNQLLGVYDQKWLQPLTLALRQLGSDHVMVVHSADGLDEISIADETLVCELVDGRIANYRIQPEQFQLQRAPLEEICVSSVQESLQMVQAVLDNQPGAARDIVLLNAGAAIFCAGISQSLEQGICIARQVLADGLAKQKLQQLVQLSQQLAHQD